MIWLFLSLRGRVCFPLSEIWTSTVIYFDQNIVEGMLFDIKP